MKLIDYVILGIVILIIGGAVWYIRRAGKKGIKCIGCPDGAKCTGSCPGCCCECNHQEE